MDWLSVLNVIGFALTGAGVWFAVIQLRRTATATEAVRHALGSLRNRMASFDYASECVRAGRGLQHACQLLKIKQWGDAASTLFDAQLALHRLSVSAHGSEEARAAAANASNFILETLPTLEDANEKHIEVPTAEIIMAIRKQINVLEGEMLGVNQDMYGNV